MTDTTAFSLIPVGDSAAGYCEGDVCVVPDASTPLRDIPFLRPDGGTVALSDFAGQAVLIVNVASKCGLAPQYAGLQSLYEQTDGLTVIGFPSNDFMGQEPGTDAEIAEFCSVNYAVTFPVMTKVSVVGDNQHPLFAELTRQAPTADGKNEMRESLRNNGIEPSDDPDVLWNFEKFLVGTDGSVLARFAPRVTPDDPAIRDAIAAALGRADIV